MVFSDATKRRKSLFITLRQDLSTLLSSEYKYCMAMKAAIASRPWDHRDDSNGDGLENILSVGVVMTWKSLI